MIVGLDRLSSTFFFFFVLTSLTTTGRKESALAPELPSCSRSQAATAESVEAASRRQRELVADETAGGLFHFI